MVTASFNGLDFLTESHDSKSGRRLVVHEFPGADQPLVEDLGAKADEFKLNAYFIGADYDLARDKFLLALNTPDAQWLMHPWRGALWVRAHSWSVHESNDKGGYCTISVDFVPGGQVQTVLVDRMELADRAIKIFNSGVTLDYTPVPTPADQVAKLAALVSSQLDRLRDALAFATLPLTWANQVRGVLDGIRADVARLGALPTDYASAMRGLADTLGAGDGTLISDFNLPQVVSSLVAVARQPAVLASDSPALRGNLQREANLRSQLLLSSAAQIALAEYRVAEDRDAVLSSIVGAVDALLPNMSDAVFAAALDMRATLIEALLAQQLEPAAQRDVVSPLPATLLAHRLEVSEEVFLAVNRVRHPLFVQGRVYG
jgi:prophage DNA circulation protein